MDTDGKIRLGVVCARFIPLHDGAIGAIDRAIRENDEIVVCVTGHDMDPGMAIVPFLRRVQLMHDIYGCGRRGPNVHVAEIHEPDGRTDGHLSKDELREKYDAMFRQARLAPDFPGRLCTWDVDDPCREERIAAAYPGHACVRLPAGALSAMNVRRNLAANVDRIHPAFLKYLLEEGVVPDGQGYVI